MLFLFSFAGLCLTVGEGEKWEAMLGDVGHQVVGERLVKLVLAVGGDSEGLAEELQGVAESSQQGVQLMGLGLTLQLAKTLGLAVYLEVKADCKEGMDKFCVYMCASVSGDVYRIFKGDVT